MTASLKVVVFTADVWSQVTRPLPHCKRGRCNIPVVFAPPQVFNPYLDAATGYLERTDKDREFAAKQQVQQAAIAQRQQQQQLEAQQQGFQQQRQAAEFQQRQIEYQQQPQREQQHLDARREFEKKREQDAWTTAEDMDLQRRQNQVTQINQALDNWELDWKEAEPELDYLRQGIAERKARKEKSQQEATDAQNKARQTQLTNVEAQNEAIRKLQVQSVAERTRNIPIGDTGHTLSLYTHTDGKVYPKWIAPEKTPRDLAAEAAVKEENKWKEDAHKEVMAEYNEARKLQAADPKKNTIPDHLGTAEERTKEALSRFNERMGIMRPDSVQGQAREGKEAAAAQQRRDAIHADMKRFGPQATPITPKPPSVDLQSLKPKSVEDATLADIIAAEERRRIKNNAGIIQQAPPPRDTGMIY